MKEEQLPLQPVPRRKYRNLKEALRKNIWGSKKDAAVIAADAGIDGSVLSRWMSDNPDDNSGKWVNKLIPLLVAMEEHGDDVVAYINEAVAEAREAARRAREQEQKKMTAAEAEKVVAEMGPQFFEAFSVWMQTHIPPGGPRR
jgi:hypothetical protein